LWNYTRAHSSQIYQVLFFSLTVLFWVRFARREPSEADGSGSRGLQDSRDFLWCVLSLSALCLVKLAFAPLIGVLGIATVLLGRKREASLAAHLTSNLAGNAKLYGLYGVVPLLVLAALVLWVNDFKFGGPFKMGYERETNQFGASLAESIPAYLIAPRYSMFIHFPLLAVGLLGLPTFWRRHRAELLVAWTWFATMFFIYANYIYWMAEASYGPRYLLFALPVLSLPAVAVIDGLRLAKRGPGTALACVALAALILWSSYTQTLVNRLEFHTFFRLRQQFQQLDRTNPALGQYLRDTNTAVFNRDFIRYRDRGITPPPLLLLKPKLGAERYRNLEASVRAHLRSNHYFW
jgi:hypothetical protein